MQHEKIIAKLIDLEDRAEAHRAEYLKLQYIPGKKTIASSHYRQSLRLRSRIRELIRKIALFEADPPVH